MMVPARVVAADADLERLASRSITGNRIHAVAGGELDPERGVFPGIEDVDVQLSAMLVDD